MTWWHMLSNLKEVLCGLARTTMVTSNLIPLPKAGFFQLSKIIAQVIFKHLEKIIKQKNFSRNVYTIF